MLFRSRNSQVFDRLILKAYLGSNIASIRQEKGQRWFEHQSSRVAVHFGPLFSAEDCVADSLA